MWGSYSLSHVWDKCLQYSNRCKKACSCTLTWSIRNPSSLSTTVLGVTWVLPKLTTFKNLTEHSGPYPLAWLTSQLHHDRASCRDATAAFTVVREWEVNKMSSTQWAKYTPGRVQVAKSLATKLWHSVGLCIYFWATPKMSIGNLAR
jgi:hypothetical protein